MDAFRRLMTVALIAGSAAGLFLFAMHADTLPLALSRNFALASVGSQAVFWLALGKLGGHLYERRL